MVIQFGFKCFFKNLFPCLADFTNASGGDNDGLGFVRLTEGRTGKQKEREGKCEEGSHRRVRLIGFLTGDHSTQFQKPFKSGGLVTGCEGYGMIGVAKIPLPTQTH